MIDLIRDFVTDPRNYGVVGTVIGATATIFVVVLGLWLTVPRLRRETRYERTLIWCEDMVRCLNEARAVIVYVTDETATEEERDIKRDVARVFLAYERLLPYCRTKTVYANKAAFHALGASLNAFEALLKTQIELAKEGKDLRDCKEQKDVCLRHFQDAIMKLMLLARRHLSPWLSRPCYFSTFSKWPTWEELGWRTWRSLLQSDEMSATRLRRPYFYTDMLENNPEALEDAGIY